METTWTKYHWYIIVGMVLALTLAGCGGKDDPSKDGCMDGSCSGGDNPDYSLSISVQGIPAATEAFATTNAESSSFFKRLVGDFDSTVGNVYGVKKTGEMYQLLNIIESTGSSDSGKMSFPTISEVLVFPIEKDDGVTSCKMVLTLESPVTWLSEAQLTDNSCDYIRAHFMPTITDTECVNLADNMAEYWSGDSRNPRSCSAFLIDDNADYSGYEVKCLEHRGNVEHQNSEGNIQEQNGVVYYLERIDSNGGWNPPSLVAFNAKTNTLDEIVSGEDTWIQEFFINPFETNNDRFGIFAKINQDQTEPIFRFINVTDDGTQAFNIASQDTWDLKVAFAKDSPITKENQVLFIARNPADSTGTNNSKNLYAYDIDKAREIRDVAGTEYCASNEDGTGWLKEKIVDEDGNVALYTAETCLADGYYWFGDYCTDENGLYVDKTEAECVATTAILSTVVVNPDYDAEDAAADPDNYDTPATLVVCAEDTGSGYVAVTDGNGDYIEYGDDGSRCPDESTVETTAYTYVENAPTQLNDSRTAYTELAVGESNNFWNPSNSAQCSGSQIALGWDNHDIAVDNDGGIFVSGLFRQFGDENTESTFKCSIRHSGSYCEYFHPDFWSSTTTNENVLLARSIGTKEECSAAFDASEASWRSSEDSCKLSIWDECEQESIQTQYLASDLIAMGFDSGDFQDDCNDLRNISQHPDGFDAMGEGVCKCKKWNGSLNNGMGCSEFLDTDDDVTDEASCEAEGGWLDCGWSWTEYGFSDPGYNYELRGEDCDNFEEVVTDNFTESKDWFWCERDFSTTTDITGIAKIGIGKRLLLVTEDVDAELAQAGRHVFLKIRNAGDDHIASFDLQSIDAETGEQVYTTSLVEDYATLKRIYPIADTVQYDSDGREVARTFRVFYLDLEDNNRYKADLVRTVQYNDNTGVQTTSYDMQNKEELTIDVNQIVPLGSDAGGVNCSGLGRQ